MEKKPLIIFGATDLASLTAYCLSTDAGATVMAHVVDDQYATRDAFEGRPVIKLSQVQNIYPPDACEILIPLGYTNINGVRKERCEQFREMGYRLHHYTSSQATVWPGCQVSDNTLIFENAIIQPHATLGENIIIRAGANIGHHSSVGDHTFIASGVTTGGNVSIGAQSFIGLGATIRDGVQIAVRCFIGAGSVIISDTEPDGVYVGNPARRLKKNALEVTASAN